MSILNVTVRYASMDYTIQFDGVRPQRVWVHYRDKSFKPRMKTIWRRDKATLIDGHVHMSYLGNALIRRAFNTKREQGEEPFASANSADTKGR